MIFNNIVFFFLRLFFALTNSVDPDEMQFSWIFTVYNFTHLGFPVYKRLRRYF